METYLLNNGINQCLVLGHGRLRMVKKKACKRQQPPKLTLQAELSSHRYGSYLPEQRRCRTGNQRQWHSTGRVLRHDQALEWQSYLGRPRRPCPINGAVGTGHGSLSHPLANPKPLRERCLEKAQCWSGVPWKISMKLGRFVQSASAISSHHLEARRNSAHQAQQSQSAWLGCAIRQKRWISAVKTTFYWKAWGPFGQGELFQNPDITDVADRWQDHCSNRPAWSLQEGFLPLPKSGHSRPVPATWTALTLG